MIVFIFIRCSNLSVVNSRFETEPHSQSTTNYSIWGNDWKNVFTSVYLQLNSCNLNSCNSKDHLNRTNSLVATEFTSKTLQGNSFHSNSHNSKNHLYRTSFWILWTYFSSCKSNFSFRVLFFHPSIL